MTDAWAPEQFRSILDNLREVVFQTDREGRWTFLNPAWEEITGFPVEDSLGMVFLEFVHPEDRETNQQKFRPLIERKKECCRHEVRYLTKAGGFRWIEVHARLTLNEAGEILGTSGTLSDVTERRQANEELQEARRSLEFVLASNPAATYVARPQPVDETRNRSTEESLKLHTQILEAVNFAAQRFLNSASWRSEIDAVLARLGEATGASRVYIFRNASATGDLVALRCHEWESPAAEHTGEQGQDAVEYTRLGPEGCVDLLRAGKPVYGQVRDFPEPTREVQARRNTQAILLVSIFANQAWWGSIGIDDCAGDREWSGPEIGALEAASQRGFAPNCGGVVSTGAVRSGRPYRQCSVFQRSLLRNLGRPSRLAPYAAWRIFESRDRGEVCPHAPGPLRP
jgi:PAS domain S-box-containing protein